MAKKDKDDEKSDRRSLGEVEALINSGDGLDLSDEDKAFLKTQVKTAKERSSGDGAPAPIRELRKARNAYDGHPRQGTTQAYVMASEMIPRAMHMVAVEARKGLEGGSYLGWEWVTCRAFRVKGKSELEPTGKTCPACTLRGKPNIPAILFVVGPNFTYENKKSKKHGEVEKSPLRFIISDDTYALATLMSMRNESGPMGVVRNKKGKPVRDDDGKKVKKRQFTKMVFFVTRKKKRNSDRFGEWRFIGIFDDPESAEKNERVAKLQKRAKIIRKRIEQVPSPSVAFPVLSEDDMIVVLENHIALCDAHEVNGYRDTGRKRFERRDFALDNVKSSDDDEDDDDDDDDDDVGDDPLNNLFDKKKGKDKDKKSKKKK